MTIPSHGSHERGTDAAAGSEPVAIICAGGSLPLRVAETAVRNGRRVVLIGIRGVADPGIARFPHVWSKLGQGLVLRRALEQNGCRELCLIGHLTRPSLRTIGLDREMLRLAGPIARTFMGGDDHLLSGLARILEQNYGVKVIGAHEIAPDLLAPAGQLGRHGATVRDCADIRTGLDALQALGPYDVGQALVIGDRHVWGIEALEGTDGLLARIADLRRTGRLRAAPGTGVLVKAAKPGQDRRLDLPTIGPRTVAGAAEAGLAGVAVVANATLLAEPEQIVATADRLGVFVVGVDPAAEDAAP